MAGSDEVDALGGRTTADQFIPVFGGEHPVLGEHRESWNLQQFPFAPARLMDCFDRAFHDVGVEAWDEPFGSGLKISNARVDDAVVT